MRQAGFMAAACIYALQNNIERLAEDHSHAQQLGQALEQMPFVKNVLPVETNIVIFDVTDNYTPVQIVDLLKEKGVLSYAISSTQVRLVTHLDISADMINETISIFKQL
jgi:threonine aldolase